MSEENAVTVVGMGNRGVNLESMSDAEKFCQKIAGTDIAPKGMKAEAIFGVIQAGAELGLSPLRSLANMKIINGRVGPMGALAKALVRQANILKPGTGFKQEFKGKPGEDDWTACITTHRADESEPVTTEFSVRDAKRAALWGKEGPWKRYPKRMLMWRAVGFHMDDQYGEILMGFHIAEVLEDYPAVETVTAVMEPLAEPAKDPLLEELEAVAAELQPEPQDPIDPDDPADSEITVDGEKVDAETGEYVGPLAGVMAEAEKAAPPMTEEEAMADLIAEGVMDPKDEDLAPADPNNAAPEGEEPDLGF